MRKLLITSVAVASLAGAVPALAQGLPPPLAAQTESDVPASAAYGQNHDHDGWLADWLFGRSEKAPIAAASRENPQQQPLANRVGKVG
jgi:hypothetical protein